MTLKIEPWEAEQKRAEAVRVLAEYQTMFRQGLRGSRGLDAQIGLYEWQLAESERVLAEIATLAEK